MTRPRIAGPATKTSADLGSIAIGAVSGCYLLSGVAALIYQIAWTRRFALVFGTSELAISAVLAAYMGGLAVGALVIERRLPRVLRPLRTYALLEAVIAVCALVLVPAGLWLSQALLVLCFGGQTTPPSSAWGGTSVYFLLSAMLVLTVPTALMGASLPLLARFAVREDAHIGGRVGLLYACNTLGAVAGALLAALILLPAFGLQITIACAAGLNLAVAALAVAVDRRAVQPQGAGVASASRAIPPVSAPAARISRVLTASPAHVLPLMLLSGTVSFLHEVLWTRMLAHLLGSSISAFGVMLASFLSGIAIGGAAGARLARSRMAAILWLAAAELAAAVMAMASWWAIQHWLPERAALSGRLWFGLLLLLPLALTIGVTFPLAVRVLAVDVADSASASARVFAWNTAGAIVGALGGGFLLIPALRYEGALQLAVALNALLALAAVTLLSPQRRTVAAAVGLPAAAILALFWPNPPLALLQSSPLSARVTGTPIFYAVGQSATVSVLDQDDMLLLRTNGLPEMSVPRRGAPPKYNGELLMPALAVIARPDAADMLVVGYGAGRMIEAVPPSVHGIDVVELEPAVIAANRAMRDLRNSDPLRDGRVKLIYNDARAALSLTERRYDAIVSQPSHPWTAGASHLYTREFMQQARAHLSARGVFMQWINVGYLEADLLRSLVATMAEVFPQLRVYRVDPETLVFAASDATIEPERAPDTVRATLDRSRRQYQRLGLGSPEDLTMLLALSDAAARDFSAGAAVITDDRNRLATSQARARGRTLTAGDLSRLLAPYDEFRRPHGFVYTELGSRLDFDYIGRRLNTGRDPAAAQRLSAMARALGDGTPRAAFLDALAASADGAGDGAVQDRLRAAMQRFPDDDRLRYEYIHPQFAALAFGGAPQEIESAAAGLGAQPAAVIAAARAAAHEQWDQVAALDADLGRINPLLPWSVEASQLRVEWRIRVLNEDMQARLCEEALRIVDDALPTQDNVPLFALRARIGIGLHAAGVIVESAASFARAINGARAPASPANRAALRALIPGLEKTLDAVEYADDIDHAHWLAVHDQLDRAAAAL